MKNKIQTVPIEKLVAHPDNPNRMSAKIFAKLVRNIERTGRYEPIVVRPKGDSFEILNGHHRVKALQQLGFKTVDVVVWDVDDKEAGILLATLNRLGGSDVLEKKLALLNRLSKQMQIRTLGKRLPQTATQINRLTKMRRPTTPANMNRKSLAGPLVFFLNVKQKKVVENALSRAVSILDDNCLMLDESKDASNHNKSTFTKAEKRAIAFAYIAHKFIQLHGEENNENRVTGIEHQGR